LYYFSILLIGQVDKPLRSTLTTAYKERAGDDVNKNRRAGIKCTEDIQTVE